MKKDCLFVRHFFTALVFVIIIQPGFVNGQLLKRQHMSADGSVLAGLAQANITPPVGYSHYRGVSTGVDDSLYARAIVVGKDEHRFAVVICDLLYMDRSTTTKARSIASEKTGIPFSNIMIAATHNHTGPSYNSYIDELNQSLRPASYVAPKTQTGLDYPDWLVTQIAQSVIDADHQAMPAYLESGTTTVSGLAFNRRYILKDGTVKMNPGIGNPDILAPAGPVDSTLRLVLIKRRTDNKPIGCLSNFGLHADTYGGTAFSADFPGLLAKKMEAIYGSGFISIFANAPCGDINHIDVRPGSNIISSDAIAQKLATAIKKVIPTLRRVRNAETGLRSEIVYVPLQSFSDRELKWALSRNKPDSLFNENPYAHYHEIPFLTIRRAVKIRHLYLMQRTGEAIPPTIGTEPWHLPLEVQVFRLGQDVAIVGLPGEIFTELSLSIRNASSFKTTMVVECTNTLLPYVPVKGAFKQGSYETINSRLAPGGGEMLAETAVKLLQELKPRK